MNCKNCNHKNIISASYCVNCGAPFTKEEKENAYNKTIYGKIEKLEELKGYITLEAITGHPVFRIAIIVLILIVGLLVGRPHGNNMAIMENEAYTVSQNEENGEFYLLTKQEEVGVSLYLPQEAESITVLTPEGETEIIEVGDSIVLATNYEEPYTIGADYGKKTESINVYVFLSEALQ